MRCWPLTQDRWIVRRLQKCVHLSIRHAYVDVVVWIVYRGFGSNGVLSPLNAYVDSDYLLVGQLMLPPSVLSLPHLSAIRGSLPPARSLGKLLLSASHHQRMPGSGLTYRRWFPKSLSSCHGWPSLALGWIGDKQALPPGADLWW